MLCSRHRRPVRDGRVSSEGGVRTRCHNIHIAGRFTRQLTLDNYIHESGSLPPPLTSPPLSFPYNLDQLRSLASQLQQLKTDHYGRLLCVFAAAYLYKQTFAIPGSVFLVSESSGVEDNKLFPEKHFLRNFLPSIFLLTVNFKA